MKKIIFGTMFIAASFITINTNSIAAMGPGDEIATYACHHKANGVIDPPFFISPRPITSCPAMNEVHHNKTYPNDHDCQVLVIIHNG